jgi:TRAP-type mannitol/chloroaromatic compound transport system permease small subunit
MSWISTLNRRIGEASSQLYLIIFVLTFGEVFLRYVFHAPTIWTLEVCLILAGVQYALSGAFAQQRDAHIRIDLVYDHSPAWLRVFFDVVRFACTALFLCVIIWWGAKQAWPAILAWEGSGTPMNSPQPVILKSVIPIAGVLMLLQTFENTRKKLRGEA